MACVGDVPNPISASLPTRGVALFFIARISRQIRYECDARSAALPGALSPRCARWPRLAIRSPGLCHPYGWKIIATVPERSER